MNKKYGLNWLPAIALLLSASACYADSEAGFEAGAQASTQNSREAANEQSSMAATQNTTHSVTQSSTQAQTENEVKAGNAQRPLNQNSINLQNSQLIREAQSDLKRTGEAEKGVSKKQSASMSWEAGSSSAERKPQSAPKAKVTTYHWNRGRGYSRSYIVNTINQAARTH